MESYTLIGDPLGHSMSPMIHERLFALSGRQAEYTLTPLKAAQLPQWMETLRTLNGCNITIPHKVDIIPLLDELDDTAKRYGACNTVANRNGVLSGYNTDCTGFLRSVEHMPLGGDVLMIGCGGVGRMMGMEAVLHGARLTMGIIEQDRQRAQALGEELAAAAPAAVIGIVPVEDIRGRFDLLMNASPVGMYPRTSGCPVTDAVLENCGAVFDVVYNPVETQLVRKARAIGKPACGGAAMLVWQAVRAHEIWYGASFTQQQVQGIIADLEAAVRRDFPEEEA